MNLDSAKTKTKCFFVAKNNVIKKAYVGTSTQEMSKRKDSDFKRINRHTKDELKNSKFSHFLVDWYNTDPKDWEYTRLGKVPYGTGEQIRSQREIVYSLMDEGFDIINFSPRTFLSITESAYDFKMLGMIPTSEKDEMPVNDSKYESLLNSDRIGDYTKKVLNRWSEEDRHRYYDALQEQKVKTDYPQIFIPKKIKVKEEKYLPIFYHCFYPTMKSDEDRFFDDDFVNYDYVQGLKYLDQPEFVTDEVKNGKRKKYFAKQNGVEGYAEDFFNLLNDQVKSGSEKIILTVIPSSKVGKINVVSKIVDYLAKKYPQFIDGRYLIQKKSDEEAAHETKKKRNVEQHIDSWDSNVNVTKETSSHPVIVIDDVVSSGSSFEAADKFLEGVGFDHHKITNFAFGATYMHLNTVRASYNGGYLKQVRDVIFDLDQTIFDTADNKQAIANVGLTGFEWKKIFDLLNQNHIGYAFVTNRAKKDAENMLDQVKSMLDIPDDYILNCPFNYSEDTNDKYKPSPTMILDVMSKWGIEDQDEHKYHPDILGIGNSEDDILAYKNAGIAQAFCNFGNRVLKQNTYFATEQIDNLHQLYELLSDKIVHDNVEGSPKSVKTN